MTHFRVTVQDKQTPEEPTNNKETTLSDGDWAVIRYLRQHYLQLSQSSHAPLRSRNPDKKFIVQGGNKYLRFLFACGAVTPDNRLANLHTSRKRNR